MPWIDKHNSKRQPDWRKVRELVCPKGAEIVLLHRTTTIVRIVLIDLSLWSWVEKKSPKPGTLHFLRFAPYHFVHSIIKRLDELNERRLTLLCPIHRPWRKEPPPVFETWSDCHCKQGLSNAQASCVFLFLPESSDGSEIGEGVGRRATKSESRLSFEDEKTKKQLILHLFKHKQGNQFVWRLKTGPHRCICWWNVSVMKHVHDIPAWASTGERTARNHFDEWCLSGGNLTKMATSSDIHKKPSKCCIKFDQQGSTERLRRPGLCGGHASNKNEQHSRRLLKEVGRHAPLSLCPSAFDANVREQKERGRSKTLRSGSARASSGELARVSTFQCGITFDFRSFSKKVRLSLAFTAKQHVVSTLLSWRHKRTKTAIPISLKRINLMSQTSIARNAQGIFLRGSIAAEVVLQASPSLLSDLCRIVDAVCCIYSSKYPSYPLRPRSGKVNNERILLSMIDLFGRTVHKPVLLCAVCQHHEDFQFPFFWRPLLVETLIQSNTMWRSRAVKQSDVDLEIKTGQTWPCSWRNVSHPFIGNVNWLVYTLHIFSFVGARHSKGSLLPASTAPRMRQKPAKNGNLQPTLWFMDTLDKPGNACCFNYITVSTKTRTEWCGCDWWCCIEVLILLLEAGHQ